MIDKNSQREKFSQRLHQALDRAGVRKHGRGADILSELRSHRIFKTAQAVSKWLNSGAFPEIESLTVLAAWLGVRREWLEYGVPPMTEMDMAESADHTIHSYMPSLGKVPMISWVDAARRYNSDNASTTADEREWLWLSCPVKIGRAGYALEVSGDSMTNPGPGKTYPAGCVLFVDPELNIANGDTIIAALPNSNEATFKVLVSDAGKQYLKPINPQYPIIEMTKDIKLCGKVVGAFVPE
ncbi:peptidase S24 [Pseudomonas viridiflava]|uniref:LexA family protein n=1 Tax=Pseudomonas viridiflava TaxID=33069 RepID=UPI001786540F|nr:S24 family peptidase [Pseudomonas viridiflava]MBD8187795.1 peptidase S24 [Pseudomonas viridiflava]